jgi:hypothetical protein
MTASANGLAKGTFLAGTASAILSALRRAAREGRLIVSEIVVAAIRTAFESNTLFEEFLGDWGLESMPSTLRSSFRAWESVTSSSAPPSAHPCALPALGAQG